VSDTAPRSRRFPWLVYWILFALIAILAVLPVFTTVLAAAIANAYDCNISESVKAVCMINGQDWGDWLQFGGLSVLYIFLTFPLAFVLFIIWLIVLLIHRARFGRVKPA
jgi:hypothetical protein